MIKIVAKTIFVLSVVLLIGSQPSFAFAAQKPATCTSLDSYLTFLPTTSKVSATPQLYLPFENTYFLKQTVTGSLPAEVKEKKEYVAEIGEGDASDITPTPTPETEIVVAPTSAVPTDQSTENSTSGSLDADKIFALVNQQRANAGLPPFQHDPRICDVAASRGPELYNEIMVTHTMHAGFYARNLPYWATENMIYMRSEEEAVNWWMHSPVHRSAILGNYAFACGTCVGNACDMIFTNFEPKK